VTLTKSLRKRAASSVSSFEVPEQFHWHKWLRRGPTPDYYEVEPLFTRVMDTAYLNKWIALPGTSGYKTKISKVRLPKVAKKYFLQPVKTNAVFFSAGKPSIKKFELYGIDKVEIYFSFVKNENEDGLYYFIEKEDQQKVISPQPGVEEIKNYFFNKNIKSKEYKSSFTLPESFRYNFEYSGLPTRNIKLKNNVEVKEINNYKIEQPVVTNQLASFSTVIYNINILTCKEFSVPGTTILNGINFYPLIKIPKIFKVKNLNFSSTFNSFPVNRIDAKLLNLPGLTQINIPFLHKGADIFTSSRTEISYINTSFEKIDAIVAVENILSMENLLQDKYEHLLKPEIKLGNEEYKEIFKSLYSYQEDAALFLLENKHGLICEQLGMGKTVEICAALRILQKKKECRYVLIISPAESIGDSVLSDATGENIGWLGHLLRWFPESTPKVIKGDRSERRELWQQPALFSIISYKQFIDDLDETLKDGKLLSRFDCIIADEVQYIEKENLLTKLIRLVNPQNFWFTTSLPYGNLAKILEFDKKTSAEVNAVLTNKHERIKEEVTDFIPDILRQDVWLELDPEQQYEYNVALSNTRDQISELYTSGNPYRFQAKIFFLLHQLKQICNFVGENQHSPKAKILLRQLEIIANNKQKVLIFTQYDKFGTKMIESILKEKDIRYVTYLAGMTVPEMEKAIISFRKDKNIPVFLAGLRAAGVRENIVEVPYVIHFDQWWNPVTHWQIENRVNHPEDKKIKVTNLNVFNYLVKNTFEEKLKIKLASKGLLIPNIIESLSAEAVTKLIRDDEWLDILGIVEKDERKNFPEIKEVKRFLSPDEFYEKARGFFSVLGYKNLKIDSRLDEDKVLIQGSYFGKNKQINMVAACYFEPGSSTSSMKEFIDHTEKNKNVDKIFIIVNGVYAIKSKLTLNKNVTFLDGESFRNYIDQFQII